ncbi:hypothetical protein ANCDUO_09916 [Ancylostoma duodenale]|uniref:Uncharacterized protein n=1 Tax=Ancylostoma duodenale TaxID=51022 RepID=A0A0C2GLM5_9BILA|nr:hypothetical protein ANCDUO_09916 [Ancylostoma duodenale]
MEMLLIEEKGATTRETPTPAPNMARKKMKKKTHLMQTNSGTRVNPLDEYFGELFALVQLLVL